MSRRMTKGERREEKRQKARKHRVSGRSVFTILHAIGKRAAEVVKKHD